MPTTTRTPARLPGQRLQRQLTPAPADWTRSTLEQPPADWLDPDPGTVRAACGETVADDHDALVAHQRGCHVCGRELALAADVA